jgi:cytochrome oxidase assembly protein ShyY1
VRQNLDIAAFAQETGLRLHPLVIEQHSAAPDGLVREWPRPDMGAEKHEGYAMQWYALAGLAVVLFVALSFRRVAAA